MRTADALKLVVAVIVACILVGVAVWVFVVKSRPLPGPPGGTPPARPPVARFTWEQGIASTVELASTSTSPSDSRLRCSWVVDSVQRFAGCRVTRALAIGDHDVELVVADEDGGTARTKRTIGPVIWRGTPYVAQRDNANRADPLATDPLGPWRVVSCVNNGYSLVNRSDGVGEFTVHQGDHPGATGGDRCAITINEAYQPYINPAGLRPRERRFYRIDVGVPEDWPTRDIGGYETFAEWHGVSSGPSLLTIGTSVDNSRLEFSYAPSVNGVSGERQTFDSHPIAPGTFHRYVVELLQSPDPEVGYFRVWRDGRCRTCGDPRADADGKVFGRTQKIVGGVGETQAFGVENYRGKEITVPTTVLHRNTMIGPTFDSVAGG